jgi:hypothetical protein
MARTFVVGLVLVAACAKKDDGAPRPTAKSRESTGVGVVNAGLASAQGSAAESAKAALVAQQCALACGVHPENDPGQCTQRCATQCAATADLPGIDACAQRVASP